MLITTFRESVRGGNGYTYMLTTARWGMTLLFYPSGEMGSLQKKQSPDRMMGEFLVLNPGIEGNELRGTHQMLLTRLANPLHT